ncbi:hypothetical protein JCM18899A_40880 [Nocardioides sp. AN3]
MPRARDFLDRFRPIGTGGRRAVQSALLVIAVVMTLVPGSSSGAPPQPGTFRGGGFDACSAPPSTTMDAWLTSPYRAVGVYIGGANRHCAQIELTAAWVAHQQAAGWHLLPIYLGLQAPCTTSGKRYLMDPAHAAAQGRAEASAAVTAAHSLGMSPGTALIFDMEAYRPADAGCSRPVLAFLGAWTARLHDVGYLSGVYGSLGSTVHDLVDDYHSVRWPHPDYLYFARFDGRASVDSPQIPATYWSPHRRIHQYRGGHDESYGGVTINIDNDYVDVRPLPRARFGDFTGNGWSDLLARDTTTGSLYAYPGNGSGLESPVRIGAVRHARGQITRLGDFNRNGHEDVIAQDSSTGYLWLYPGTGSALRPRVRLGTGWNRMKEITAVGDLDGDGYPDILAIRKSTGHLLFFPGRGTRLGRRVDLGPGWNTMSELTGIGDLTGDGHPDLLARHTASGQLFLYPGHGVGFRPRVSLGRGWSGRRSLVGVGDFNRDGHPDLMAVDSETGTLRLFPGRTGGLSAGIRLPGAWANRRPLL